VSGQVSIKQDRATGKINLSQEFDKKARERTPKLKEPKSRQDNKGKKESTSPSESGRGQQPTELTKSLITGENKTVDTNVPGPKEQQPSKDESSGEILSDQGKTEGNIPSNQATQSDPNHPSNKKMTAQEWGSKFVHIHQERTAKKTKAQEFTRPESLKEKLIREGKSHPDPKDPRFPQYFKNKAIKSSPQELTRGKYF
jgi:hypothetical protein